MLSVAHFFHLSVTDFKTAP